eukprot:4832462-Pyramimonas_sp.AAC.1
MIQVKLFIELHAGRTSLVVDKIGSYLRCEFRFGTNTEAYHMDYDCTHTWARDLPICSAGHFFKKMVRFLGPEVIQESTT